MMNEIFNLIPHIIFALLGASARQFYIINNEHPFKLAEFLRNLFVAGFAAITIHYILQGLNVEDSLSLAVIGTSGWLGPGALDKMIEFMLNKFGIQIEPKSNKCENKNNTVNENPDKDNPEDKNSK